MTALILSVWLAQTAAAVPPVEEPMFEIHLDAPSNSTTARKWTMVGPGGAVQVVPLDPEVLLDARSVAAAEAVRGPDGTPQIRLVLTPDGASRLAEITSRYTGRRLGIVAGGRLRSAPFVQGTIGGGVLVVSGDLTEPETAQIAARLGPPPPGSTGGVAVPPTTPRPGVAVQELQGRWRVVEATMGGQTVGERKLALSTWVFEGGDLVLTNGEGETARFAVHPDAPGAVRLEGREANGWLLWKREGADLLIAFNDNLRGRPDGFAPAPKTILARLRAAGGR